MGGGDSTERGRCIILSEYLTNGDALTYTAGRIRAKTGGTDAITWDESKGFGDAVDAIGSGGGGTLAAVDVFIADFTDSTELSISAGAVDKYTRTIVS